MTDSHTKQKALTWSFSSIKLYENCPKKYYHLRVAKSIVEPETEAMLYGTAAHTAAEEFVRDGTPLPRGFAYMQEALEIIREIPGEKLCEFKLGLKEDLSPCEFNDPEVYFRGIADLIIIDREKKRAYVLDYKTGKNARYADTGQLELMALAVFKRFPEIEHVRAALVFVVAKEFVQTYYDRWQLTGFTEKFAGLLEQLKTSMQSDVFNPRPSGLCRAHCPVTECSYNGRR
jgi:hypothetical protein